MALITTSDFKTYMSIAHSDDDSLIAAMIPREEADVAAEIGRDLESSTHTETFDGHSGMKAIFLTQRPVASVTSVKEDGTVIDAADYDVYPEEGMIKGSFGAGNRRYAVEYAGPNFSTHQVNQLKQIVLELMAYRYQFRVPGVASERDEGASIQAGVQGGQLSAIPPEIQRKIDAFGSRRNTFV